MKFVSDPNSRMRTSPSVARLLLQSRSIVVILATSATATFAAATDVLGYDDARHLLARTGFGPTDAEVRAYAPLTREAAVAKLLKETRTAALTPPPEQVFDSGPLRYPNPESSTAEEKKAFAQQQTREGLALRAWWVREMIVTPSPLTERMTLFWHNHFVSSQAKVRLARLMYRQNVALRAHATANFGDLLHAMAKDPAMLVYLDGVRSRKGAPNENFAREVMELFTLGEGRYAEQDIKEAARAFTGWSVDRQSGEFLFRPRVHDYGVKTVFGKSAAFDGDDVLELLLARPETAQRVTAKLWREFVSPDPDPTEVRSIATRFAASRYDIKTVLSDLLLCDAFYASENRGTLVKSPTELVVGTMRSFALEADASVALAIATATMGQNLMAPPNVKGWPGGEAWINTNTLLARKQFVDRVTRAEGQRRTRAAMTPATDATNPTANPSMPAEGAMRRLSGIDFDSARFLAQFPGATMKERGQWAQRLLLPVGPQGDDPPNDVDAIVRALLFDTAYQLK